VEFKGNDDDKFPYWSIEGDLYYSTDNETWNRIRYCNNFEYHKSIFGIKGYLSTFHFGNDSELSKLIKLDKEFNLKLEFRANGNDPPLDPIYLYKTKITDSGFECYGMNDCNNVTIQYIKFKTRRCKMD
jgi:hypothetical protein